MTTPVSGQLVNRLSSRRRILRGGVAVTATGLAAVTLAASPAAAGQGMLPTTDQRQNGGARSTPSYVEVAPGVRLFVQDWGPHSGKPIVLLHGWPSNHLIFETQSVALARRGYRVVAIDMRGFGQSDQPWDGNDYDTWASDIGAVLAALDLREVTLAGYSMGGAIVMHYVATHHDNRVARLALLAAAGPCLLVKPDNPQGLPPQVFDGILQGIAAGGRPSSAPTYPTCS